MRCHFLECVSNVAAARQWYQEIALGESVRIERDDSAMELSEMRRVLRSFFGPIPHIEPSTRSALAGPVYHPVFSPGSDEILHAARQGWK